MLFDEYLAPREPAPAPRDTPAAPPPAPPRADGPSRSFGDDGLVLRGPFLAFWESYGAGLCGEPLSGEILVDGMRCQVFRNLVLEEHEPGRVRPRPLGEAFLAQASSGAPAERRAPRILDLVDLLERDEAGARYPRRPLSDIRHLVLHHTGVPSDVGPYPLAREHVRELGWPGIGYHFVVGADGTIWRTQEPTTVSHHARQFNPVSLGIALAGDYAEATPPEAQLEGVAALLTELLAELGLGLGAVRGHREMVPTPCPGERFLEGWKPRLLAIAARRMGPPVRTSAP